MGISIRWTASCDACLRARETVEGSTQDEVQRKARERTADWQVELERKTLLVTRVLCPTCKEST